MTITNKKLMQAMAGAGAAALMSLPSSSAFAEMPEVDFAGFGSIVYGKTFTDSDEGEIGRTKAISDEGEYRDLNVLGFRLTSDLSDNLTFGAQLVAYGHKDYDPDFDWIYINYAFNEHWNVSIGRTRTPLYLYSDYLDVTHAQPWTTQPISHYVNAQVNNVEGLNFAYLDEIGDWSSTLQIYAGSGEEKTGENDATTLELDDMAGFSWAVEDDYWLIRTSYFKFDLTLGGQGAQLAETVLFIGGALTQDFSELAGLIATENVEIGYAAFGAAYDDGTVFTGVEIGSSTTDDTVIYTAKDSAYIFAGYRFNPEWSISLTYGVSESEESDYAADVAAQYDATTTPFLGISSQLDPAIIAVGQALDQFVEDRQVREVDELILNVRWNFHPMASLKVDLIDFSEENTESGDKLEPNGFRLGFDFIF